MATEIPAGLAIEPIFVIEGVYGPDAAERRPPVRAQHLHRMAELRDRGIVLEAGGYSDLSGSIVLVRVPDEAAALEIARADVYLSAGVWVEVRVRPFGRLVRESELEAR